MEHKDNFREKMNALDDLGFIGRPNSKESKKDEYLISAWIQASKKMWKEQGRSLEEEEKNKVIFEAVRTYNKEVRQRKKTIAFSKVASVTL